MFKDLENLTKKEIKLCIQDFRYFLIYTWKFLRLPPPTEMQLYIADYLAEGNKRCILEALRGIGKTWITGAFVCWRLLRNPNEKVLIISQTGKHSENIAIFIRKLINFMPLVKHLKPRSDQRGSIHSFDVNGCEVTVQPSVKSLGITSQLQGNRATLLIADDVEGQQNSGTEVRREQLLQAVGEFEAILQTDTATVSQIIYLGTPQSSESIYGKLSNKGFVTKIYPARYPEKIDNYNGQLADYLLEKLNNDPTLVNKPTDTRFTELDLKSREMSFGISNFKLQFMLDTTLSDSERYPLKINDLIITDVDINNAPTSISWSSSDNNIVKDIPNVGFTGDRLHRGIASDVRAPYEGKLLVIDPSGRGSDRTGVAVVNHLHGNIFIPYIGGITGGYDKVALIQIAQLAKTYGVEKVLVEANFGDGMFSALLQPVLNSIYPCSVEEVKVNIQKEKRIIDTIEPVVNQRRLILDYRCMLNDTNKALSGTNKDLQHSFLFQFSHITRDRNSLMHDDLIDALALGLNYWNERNILTQSTDEALKQYNNKLFNDEINRRVAVYNRNKGITKPRVATSRLRGFR